MPHKQRLHEVATNTALFEAHPEAHTLTLSLLHLALKGTRIKVEVFCVHQYFNDSAFLGYYLQFFSSVCDTEVDKSVKDLYHLA